MHASRLSLSNKTAKQSLCASSEHSGIPGGALYLVAFAELTVIIISAASVNRFIASPLLVFGRSTRTSRNPPGPFDQVTLVAALFIVLGNAGFYLIRLCLDAGRWFALEISV